MVHIVRQGSIKHYKLLDVFHSIEGLRVNATKAIDGVFFMSINEDLTTKPKMAGMVVYSNVTTDTKNTPRVTISAIVDTIGRDSTVYLLNDYIEKWPNTIILPRASNPLKPSDMAWCMKEALPYTYGNMYEKLLEANL